MFCWDSDWHFFNDRIISSDHSYNIWSNFWSTVYLLSTQLDICKLILLLILIILIRLCIFFKLTRSIFSNIIMPTDVSVVISLIVKLASTLIVRESPAFYCEVFSSYRSYFPMILSHICNLKSIESRFSIIPYYNRLQAWDINLFYSLLTILARLKNIIMVL